MHLFGRNRDHDYYFELLVTEKRDTHCAGTIRLQRAVHIARIDGENPSFRACNKTSLQRSS